MPHLTLASGIQWHYDVEGEGERLVFIHGWGVDKRIWRQQSKFFSQFYRVLTVDLPGHGKSSWEKVDLAVMVSDLNALLQEEGFGNVTVIGSSLGGLVALKLYQMFPETVERMVFVGAMPKFSKSEDYPYGLDVDRMRKLGSQLQTDYPAIIDVFFRSLFTPQERRTRRYKWLQKFRRNVNMPIKQALADYLDILEQEDLRQVLKDIRIPVQFINGRDDEICTKETVAFLQETAPPKTRFDFFEQCGHFPFLSKPHEFNQVLRLFLTESA